MDITYYAVMPTGDQYDSFIFQQGKDGADQPVEAVGGDSRANEEGSAWMSGGGAPADIDFGISGDTTENWDWSLLNFTTDMSHTKAYVFECGVNSIRFGTGGVAETEQHLLKATMAGEKFVIGEMAAGAHFYYNEIYDELDNAYGANPMIDAVNADMAAKAAASGGTIVYVAINSLLTSADYHDPTHLNASGNAKVVAADIAAMSANGDYPGHAPHVDHIISIDDGLIM